MAGVGTAAGPTTRNLSRCPQEERGDSADRGVWVLVNRARVVVPAVMVLPHMSEHLPADIIPLGHQQRCSPPGASGGQIIVGVDAEER